MNKLLQLLGYKVSDKTGFSISVKWCWSIWTTGWVGELADYGFGVLVIGPLQLHVTWPLAEWPGDVAPR